MEIPLKTSSLISLFWCGELSQIFWKKFIHLINLCLTSRTKNCEHTSLCRSVLVFVIQKIHTIDTALKDKTSRTIHVSVWCPGPESEPGSRRSFMGQTHQSPVPDCGWGTHSPRKLTGILTFQFLGGKMIFSMCLSEEAPWSSPLGTWSLQNTEEEM